jgi:hypothetical protein
LVVAAAQEDYDESTKDNIASRRRQKKTIDAMVAMHTATRSEHAPVWWTGERGEFEI